MIQNCLHITRVYERKLIKLELEVIVHVIILKQVYSILIPVTVKIYGAPDSWTSLLGP